MYSTLVQYCFIFGGLKPQDSKRSRKLTIVVEETFRNYFCALTDKVLHDVLGRGRDLGVLPLHDWDELGDDLPLLVPGEEVGHLTTGGEDVVHVLKETLFFDVLMGEEGMRFVETLYGKII